LRIIAGISRGRKLVSPKDSSIRPTGDRVKEALFSMIDAHLPGSKVLDLFAGTGSLGLEALSRGAEFATFVENSPKSLELLKKNIELAGFKAQSEVIYKDALRAAAAFGKSGRVFDIIFVDPPYKENLYEKVLSSIENYGIIRNGGLVVVEYPAAMAINEAKVRFIPVRSKRYGNTAINIYTRGDDHENSSIPGKF
jgi:16S rRNA (guanine(966)-N(2))-methyltransferase RsmD